MTDIQRNALKLAATRNYFYHERSGGARVRNHRPGVTPVITRRTLYVVGQTGLGLTRFDSTGALVLTDDGYRYAVAQKLIKPDRGRVGLADCGCPQQIINDEGHQAGCQVLETKR